MRRSNLDTCGKLLLKIKIKLESVVNLVIGYVVEAAVYLLYLSVVYYSEHLVDEMYSPVKHHSAAVLLVASPVTGNTARTLYSGFNSEYVSKLTRGVNLLHHQIVAIPTAILVYGKQFSRTVRRFYHFLKLKVVKTNGFLTYNVLPCLHCLNGNRQMALVGNGNCYYINAFVGQHVFK